MTQNSDKVSFLVAYLGRILPFISGLSHCDESGVGEGMDYIQESSSPSWPFPGSFTFSQASVFIHKIGADNL